MIWCCCDPTVGSGGGDDPPPPLDVSLANVGGGAKVYVETSGPNPFELRTLTVGAGLSIVENATTITITNTDRGSSVTMASAGGTESLVNDGIGPALATKGLTAGTGISLTASATAITITNTDLGSDVTLASAGSGDSLVVEGIGPNLEIKSISPGFGIFFTVSATDIQISMVNVTLLTTGLGTSQVFDGVGPELIIKGLLAGSGITLSADVDNYATIITNTDPGSAVTAASAGGTESVVNDGVGPALAFKGLTAGTGVSLSASATAITITNSDTGSAVTAASAGGTESVVNDGVGPALAFKGLTAGTGVSLTASATAITIANTDLGSSVTLANAGNFSLVSDGVGPALAIKGLIGSVGISIVDTGIDLRIENTCSIASAGGVQTLINTGAGPAMFLKGLTAGTGMTLSSTASAITITNSDLGSSVTLANAGTTSLVNDGVGPAIATKGLVAGSGISFSTSATDVTISLSSPVTVAGSEIILNVNGSDVAHTTRRVTGSAVQDVATQCLVSIASGTQVVKARWRTVSGSGTSTITNRSLQEQSTLGTQQEATGTSALTTTSTTFVDLTGATLTLNAGDHFVTFSAQITPAP